MCGIFATNRALSPLSKEIMEARRRTSPRGPDGFAQERVGSWLLEHHALKTTGDAFQPFRIEAGSRSIAWAVNGQFYRHELHREELAAKGARFETDCDSEILGWIWLLEGVDGLGRLEGEFAWILADSSDGALWCGRDLDGARPMHWAKAADGSLSAASDWIACARLAGLGGASRAYFEQSFPMQYAPADLGPVEGLRRIGPGELMRAAPGCDPVFLRHPASGRSFLDGEALRGAGPELAMEALEEACRARMPRKRAAAHLSSGLDSAAICALLSKLGEPPAAYCVDFGPGGEIEGARLSARLLGLDLRGFEYSASRGLRDLEWSCARSGHACMDAHVGAKARLSDRIAADGFRVVFSGEGADEAFLGYEHCLAESGLASKESSMAGVHTTSRRIDCPAWMGSHGRTPKWMQAKLAMCEPLAALLLAPAEESAERLALARAAGASGIDFPRAATEAWRRRVMSGYILPAVDDGASSASGLESRMPFLDARLLALARAIPSERHLEGGRSKALLREALGSCLPEPIRERPKRPFMGSSLIEACQADRSDRDLLLGLLEQAPWGGWIDKPKTIELAQSLLGRSPNAAADATLWLLASSACLAKLAEDLR